MESCKTRPSWNFNCYVLPSLTKYYSFIHLIIICVKITFRIPEFEVNEIVMTPEYNIIFNFVHSGPSHLLILLE
jgi:hypothetical protein